MVPDSRLFLAVPNYVSHFKFEDFNIKSLKGKSNDHNCGKELRDTGRKGHELELILFYEYCFTGGKFKREKVYYCKCRTIF